MIDRTLLVKLIDEHIKSKGCSLFGKARDVGTDQTRRRVAEDLVAEFVGPILDAYVKRLEAERQHPAGQAHRADPESWDYPSLTSGNVTGGVLGGSEGKSVPRTFPPSSSNGSPVTAFTGGTLPDLAGRDLDPPWSPGHVQDSPANPPWHHSRESWGAYLARRQGLTRWPAE